MGRDDRGVSEIFFTRLSYQLLQVLTVGCWEGGGGSYVGRCVLSAAGGACRLGVGQSSSSGPSCGLVEIPRTGRGARSRANKTAVFFFPAKHDFRI